MKLLRYFLSPLLIALSARPILAQNTPPPNVVDDLAESRNLLEKYPDIVRRLSAVAERDRSRI